MGIMGGGGGAIHHVGHEVLLLVTVKAGSFPAHSGLPTSAHSALRLPSGLRLQPIVQV